jgi:drug/metabolite transporter (DMT)-like permease
MLVAGEVFPGPSDVGFAIGAGIAGSLGIVSLYRGLAEGRMGIVAPVAGVLAAVVPVVVGAAIDGLPPREVLAGIGLAFAAVVLVSSSRDQTGRPSGLAFGIAAGLGFGVFNVLIAGLTPGLVFGPLTVLRLVEAILIGAIIVSTRRSWRVPPGLLPAVAAVAVLDLGGNVFYILATQAGRLDIAATTSSLYPVTTLVLALIVLRERVDRWHAAGILAAVGSIVLITTGSGG